MKTRCKPTPVLRCFLDPGESQADDLALDGDTFPATLNNIGKIMSVGDRVLEGALDEWLSKLNAGDGRLPMLWAHDDREPIGYWDDLRIDGSRLKATGHIWDYMQRGQEAAEAIARRDVNGVSLGLISSEYDLVRRPGKSVWGGDKWGVDHIKSSAREASIVMWPADRNARASRRRNGRRRDNADIAAVTRLAVLRNAVRLIGG